MTSLVHQALAIFVSLMNDSSEQVKDTTAWTLGRICDLLSSSLKIETHVHPLVMALVSGLDGTPRIAANSAWGLMNLADALGAYNEEDGIPTSGPLSPYCQVIMEGLMRVTEK
jgi:importin subunit beta-1